MKIALVTYLDLGMGHWIILDKYAELPIISTILLIIVSLATALMSQKYILLTCKGICKKFSLELKKIRVK